MNGYSCLTRRYFETAAGAGVLSGSGVRRGAAGSPAQGTWVQFDLRVGDPGRGAQRILAARFLAFGCPHTIAVCSWIAEQATGTIPEAALPESLQRLKSRFEVPAEKMGRLLVIEDAWIAAIGA